ncbi:MAG TPA: hypothetical protein VFN61_12960, partial [Acidimicrobiales bacterium]|nr:hypothetical protein [Acidimicrobiales bacterium]
GGAATGTIAFGGTDRAGVTGTAAVALGAGTVRAGTVRAGAVGAAVIGGAASWGIATTTWPTVCHVRWGMYCR